MEQILECVPNFSEGKDPKVLKAILQSLKGVEVLDHCADLDHNRSVFTFIGEPDKVIEAAFQACRTAAKLIDLTKHKGVHPRVGATDVIPLIPIKGITEKEAVALSISLAKRIGEELNIPTYLYEKSATIPSHKNLANLRAKGFKDSPDFGPATAGPAGFTVVGVRDFLIAFNINLKTSDLKIAKTIATQIREKDGGLPCVKALGLKLASKGITQISMNLTNYRITPPIKVFRLVRSLAHAHGTKILESELIGLIPPEALKNTSPKELMIKDFNEKSILSTQ
ncbi:glutamate formimidoyltransferase [Patescibacteria group bacterium]|nr:glutamate formimidoyltransferase [Patescibacteria group bacterium]